MSGFFRGVSADQDSRFNSKKDRLLLKAMHKFVPDQKAVDFSGVNWEVIKPWLSKRVTEFLGGIEDDVVILYIEEQVVDKKSFDPSQLVVNISGFLEGQTETFVRELWSLLVSATMSTSGIPESFLKKKQTEVQINQEEDLKVLQHIERSRHISYNGSNGSYDHPGRHRNNRRRSRSLSPEPQQRRGDSRDRRSFNGSPLQERHIARSRSLNREGNMR